MTPSSQRISEINTGLTEKLWENLESGERLEIRNKKETNFLLHEIPQLKAVIEILIKKIDSLENGTFSE